MKKEVELKVDARFEMGEENGGGGALEEEESEGAGVLQGVISIPEKDA